jgi:hypothetical protein
LQPCPIFWLVENPPIGKSPCVDEALGVSASKRALLSQDSANDLFAKKQDFVAPVRKEETCKVLPDITVFD